MKTKQRCGAIKDIKEFGEILAYLELQKMPNSDTITLVMSEEDYKITNKTLNDLSAGAINSARIGDSKLDLNVASVIYGGYRFILTTDSDEMPQEAI